MSDYVSTGAKSLRGIEAVAFDAFGTLVEYPLRLNPYRRLLGPLREGAESSTATLRHRILTSSETPEQLARSRGLEEEIPAMRDELDRELAAMRLYPDVLDTIHGLRAGGYRIGVCSNLAQAYGDLVRFLLGAHVDALVLSFEVGLVKPDPAIFELLGNRLGAAPRATLFIGDSLASDVDGAKKAGMSGWELRRDIGRTLRDVLRDASGS